MILIDGGKGQVNIAAKVLAKLGILNKIDLIGLAKGRSEKKIGRRTGRIVDYEYVVKPNQKNKQQTKATVNYESTLEDNFDGNFEGKFEGNVE